jgi:ABC-type Fe3+/spermidine/putrescine transport system ATPase subunit
MRAEIKRLHHAVMNGGVQQQFGPPEDIYQRPAHHRAHLGDRVHLRRDTEKSHLFAAESRGA